jgi:dihydropteroate synthase
MCFLAKQKGTLPKDLGFDLLLAKGKEPGVNVDVEGVPVVPVSDIKNFNEDKKGYFNIYVDFTKNKIIAAHAKKDYDCVFEGDSSEALSKEIIEKGLISNLEHATYLGRELQKAEIFLKLGKGYVQDEDFLGL